MAERGHISFILYLKVCQLCRQYLTYFVNCLFYITDHEGREGGIFLNFLCLITCL